MEVRVAPRGLLTSALLLTFLTSQAFLAFLAFLALCPRVTAVRSLACPEDGHASTHVQRHGRRWVMPGPAVWSRS